MQTAGSLCQTGEGWLGKKRLKRVKKRVKKKKGKKKKERKKKKKKILFHSQGITHNLVVSLGAGCGLGDGDSIVNRLGTSDLRRVVNGGSLSTKSYGHWQPSNVYPLQTRLRMRILQPLNCYLEAYR